MMKEINPSLMSVFKRQRPTESVNSSFQSVANLPSLGIQLAVSSSFRLFESFMIVSTDQISRPSKGGQSPAADAKILLKYPNSLESGEVDVIPGFCYPLGVAARPLQGIDEARQ